MKKETPIQNYSYLKKDFLKFLLTTGSLLIFILILFFLDSKMKFTLILADKIMKILLP